MGRNTFLPALEADQWPWSGLRVYVLTSRPLRLLRADRVFPDGSVELGYALAS